MRLRSIHIFTLVYLLSALWIVKSRAIPQTKVAIAGAGSSVGLAVFKKLLQGKDFQPIGLLRDRRGFDELKRLGVNDDQIRLCDLTIKSSLGGVLDGCSKLVICTTSQPKWKLSYKVKSVLRWFVGRGRPPRIEELYYAPNRRPFEVDFLGQKNLIDESVQAQLEHVVLLSSMGGYRGSKLNDIGRSKDDTDVHNGNVIKWKRAAERYLIKRRPFTILHAATITKDPGGKKSILWDTDDALLRTPYTKIPVDDAAEVIVQALLWNQAIGRSIDIAAGEESGPTDWPRFWSRPGDCVYPSDFDDPSFN